MASPADYDKNTLPDLDECARWLTRHLQKQASVGEQAQVTQLEALKGGFWSRAYGCLINGEPTVVRFAWDGEGFDIDSQAAQLQGAGFAVPQVFDWGPTTTQGGSPCWYALSKRYFGRFPDDLSPADAQAGTWCLTKILEGLVSIEPPNQRIYWWQQENSSAPAPSSWRERLTCSLRSNTPSHPEYPTDTTQRGRMAFDELLEACPERRDVVHGDLLYHNVLLTPQLDGVEAVFSWKCSTLGDHFYDVAWCLFWGEYHAGVDPDVVLEWLQRVPYPDPLMHDWPTRVRCYQLHIALTHLEWFVQTDDADMLQWTAARIEDLLKP